MKIKTFLAGLFFLVNGHGALAQNGCLASFNVDTNKSLTVFGWLPNDAGVGVSNMSCVAAEEMRARIFIDYLGGNQETIFSSPDQYTSELTRRHDALVQKRDELKQQLDSGSGMDALRAVAKVFWYETEKFFTILACVAPEPTTLSKAGCAVGLVDIARTTAGLGDDISQSDIRQKLQLVEGTLSDIEPFYQATVQGMNQSKVGSAKANLNAAFNGLCQAVRQQCL
jgi:hypothetical protein